MAGSLRGGGQRQRGGQRRRQPREAKKKNAELLRRLDCSTRKLTTVEGLFGDAALPEVRHLWSALHTLDLSSNFLFELVIPMAIATGAVTPASSNGGRGGKQRRRSARGPTTLLPSLTILDLSHNQVRVCACLRLVVSSCFLVVRPTTHLHRPYISPPSPVRFSAPAHRPDRRHVARFARVPPRAALHLARAQSHRAPCAGVLRRVRGAARARAVGQHGPRRRRRARRCDTVSCRLCTVTFHANVAHSLTRSPSHL